ncbi:MAG: hypothetical protein AAGB31_11575 [Bdellovibrio sp.]
MSESDQGIAILVNKHWTGYYLVPHSLPSKVVVAESFHLKPLLSDIQETHACYALFLSASEGLLAHCNGEKGQELQTFLFHEGSHSNSIHWKRLEESENFQIPHLKSHLRGRGSQDNHFKRKSGLKLFLKWIEAKIRTETGYKSLPLFVFTNEALFRAYKEISAHPQPQLSLLDPNKGVPRIETLVHQVTVQLQKNLIQQRLLATKEAEESSRHKKMIDDLVNISRAALNGKVKTLFLRDNIEVWGHLHRKSGEITFHDKQQDAQDDDILDDIACEVIRQGGEVIVLKGKDMPSQSPAAAILEI